MRRRAAYTCAQSAHAKLANTFGKLSSGQRINKASDDAAGLAIADSLRNTQRIASVAIRSSTKEWGSGTPSIQ
ncbi:MAG: hypothetical protein EBS91_06565 [Betaproteobacteria bacterium]|nr:hypothetical protein [Betaproteobacteria bacterium]